MFILQKRHLFYECIITEEMEQNLISFLEKYLNLPYLTPQNASHGFPNTCCNDNLFRNHILFLFKTYIYNSRKHEKTSLDDLIRNVTKVKSTEKEIAGNNEKKIMLYDKE